MMMMMTQSRTQCTSYVRTKLPMLNSANYNGRTWLLGKRPSVMIT